MKKTGKSEMHDLISCPQQCILRTKMEILKRKGSIMDSVGKVNFEDINCFY